MHQGIYEELVTQLISEKLNSLDKNKFTYKLVSLDKEEAAKILSTHIASAVRHTLQLLQGDNVIKKQIDIANKIIMFLVGELKNEQFSENLINIEGNILKGIFSKIDADYPDLDLHIKEITPYTRLTHSELFTGGNTGISLESELRKEILSSNRIDLLVSFIKWKGIVILERELMEFARKGGQLRVITTTYMGASDAKAIEFLSKIPNAKVKVSYNTGNERLHAKAYLFYRNTGFHTGYIGSSNFSRSALTDGLEWNIKVTSKEIGHIIDKFRKTFETYWMSSDFEDFSPEKDLPKLKSALQNGKSNPSPHISTIHLDIKPHPFQLEILETLKVERLIHHRSRNLVVAATGTGKTVISAFDFKQYRNENANCKLLFVAHRKEILEQALGTYRSILKESNFGDLWVDGNEPNSYNHVFASVQTLKNRISTLPLSESYYDFIIIDEVHHIQASSYRPILEKFKPKILLGLTATPERMDGANILDDFCGRIAAEIRLPEALTKKLLCPFQYFGITDSVDLDKIKWEKGRYLASELSSIYTSNDSRVSEIISHLQKYTKDPHDVIALGFCVTMEHAQYMAEKFLLAGLKASYLTSNNKSERDQLRQKLRSKEINYLFVVDIFNEGVDIPEVDTILFLRPTESLTIFLQQLGRGLRLSDNKECLTVLDFVGNARPEYDFKSKFRALVGKTNSSIEKEIEDNFPHLPLGCSIILEPKAKGIILNNIRQATRYFQAQIKQNIINYGHQTTLPLTLENFLKFYEIPIEEIYKKNIWNRLLYLAGKRNNFPEIHEKEILSAIRKKWLSTASYSYFQFILNLANNGFKTNQLELNETMEKMMLMLHYDVWGKPMTHNSLISSIESIGTNPALASEIKEIMELLLNRIDFEEYPIHLPYLQPLKVHARYTRDQILAAFGFHSFEKQSNNREGVAENKGLNTELLFIDLKKSEEDFSPTTMYDDYAINDTLFHWQSQNAARPDSGKGLSYIKHELNNKIILLFVREQAKNEYSNTMGYVFLGRARYVEHYGSKPMSIIWKLDTPIPPYFWKETAKLAVG